MLENVKQEIINNTLDDILQNEKSNEAKRLKKIELTRKILENDTMFLFSDESVEVNSEAINENSRMLYLDMLTLHGISDVADKLIDTYKSYNYMAVESLNTKLSNMEKRIKACNESMSKSLIPEYIVEDFTSNVSFEKYKRNFHTDRYGQIFRKKNEAHFSERENVITLPYNQREYFLNYEDMIKRSKVSIRFQGGKGFIDLSSQDHFNLDNILDTTDSYWSETILSDSRMKMSYRSDKDAYTESDNYFYDIDDGAVCEIKVSMTNATNINEIVLDPNSKYPVDIVAIRYTLTDDPKEPLKEIVSPDEGDLSSTFLKNKTTYRFKSMLCKNIYILFTQRHYEKSTFLYTPSSVHSSELWFKSKNNQKDTNENVLFVARSKDRSHDEIVLNQLDLSVNERSIDLIDIFTSLEKDARKVKKYEYSYGFRNIGVNGATYDRVGYYVSKPIGLKSNYKTISVESVEEHFLVNGKKITDIEYYITGSTNPSFGDWIPIQPTNNKLIESELLFVRENSLCFLRFKTSKIEGIYANGELIDNNKYSTITNINGEIDRIKLLGYEPEVIYTISYYPLDEHFEIDLSSQLISSSESFYISSTCNVVLKERPLIGSNEDYCRVVVTNSQNRLDQVSSLAENVTDLSNPSNSHVFFNNTSGRLQYYILNNAIYFNKEIPQDSTVDVTYMHRASSIRCRAILRRNDEQNTWITPILKEIKYRIQ